MNTSQCKLMDSLLLLELRNASQNELRDGLLLLEPKNKSQFELRDTLAQEYKSARELSDSLRIVLLELRNIVQVSMIDQLSWSSRIRARVSSEIV